MSEVLISASKSYTVRIEKGGLFSAGAQIAAITNAACCAVISDDTVFSLYGKTLCERLKAAGFRVISFVFPHGEEQKTPETYLQVVNFLAANRVCRSDVLVALGGGVVGDLCGFAAATYLRGVSFVQIPTTLLAAVDSSVGGKTAVDLPCGKNLLGAFYQPSLVICDPDTLQTLPEPIFRDGCAEVIKYAVFGNAPFFESLWHTDAKAQIETVIETCVKMKRDVVAQDEFDRGLRQILNLGHTFGHAVEACSRFAVSHGSAVAIGMSMVARAAAKKGLLEPAAAEKIEAILKRYSLPTETDFSAEELYGVLCSDKKVSGKTVHLIVPRKIGKATIETVPLSDVPEWLRLGGAR